MSNKYDRHYPAIPLRNVTVFPGMVMHFDVSRKKSVKAVEASMAADELIYLVTHTVHILLHAVTAVNVGRKGYD